MIDPNDTTYPLSLERLLRTLRWHIVTHYWIWRERKLIERLWRERER